MESKILTIQLTAVFSIIENPTPIKPEQIYIGQIKFGFRKKYGTIPIAVMTIDIRNGIFRLPNLLVSFLLKKRENRDEQM